MTYGQRDWCSFLPTPAWVDPEAETRVDVVAEKAEAFVLGAAAAQLLASPASMAVHSMDAY